MNRLGLLILIANAFWLGGLLRLVGTATLAVVSTLEIPLYVVVVTAAIVAVELAALYRWSWYRNTLRQMRQDIRALYGLPAVPASDGRRTLSSRLLGLIAIYLATSLGVAALLPGVEAAAASMVIGAILRVIGTLAMVAPGERSLT